MLESAAWLIQRQDGHPVAGEACFKKEHRLRPEVSRGSSDSAFRRLRERRREEVTQRIRHPRDGLDQRRPKSRGTQSAVCRRGPSVAKQRQQALISLISSSSLAQVVLISKTTLFTVVLFGLDNLSYQPPSLMSLGTEVQRAENASINE